MNDLVPSAGRNPNEVLICGEAPGEQEWRQGQPFVGRSGIEQEWYLRRHGCSAQSMYRTNVVKRYIEGNPDPTPELIAEFSPQLEQEMASVRPRVVLAVGRFAVRWFLGDSADLEAVHGLPCLAGTFDKSRIHRGGPNNAIIIPIYHPAFGLYDPDMKGLIDYDYSIAADYAKRARLGFNGNRDFDDRYEGIEDYRIVNGRELEDILSARLPHRILGLDTETHGDEETPDLPWSIQVSTAPGTGLLLPAFDKYFKRGIRAIQRVANDQNNIIGIHNALFDIEMCRSMGLELRDARIFDTRYAAYLLRLEPQKLKLLAYRRARMHMRSYNSVVHSAARNRHLDYLWKILESKPWPKPEPVLEFKNDGSWKSRNPMKIERRVESILADAQGDKDLDIYSRWMDVDEPLRRTVEEKLGERMTPAFLGDAEPEVATRYACRDADAVIRLVPTLRRMLKEQSVETLMIDGMHILGICEEMQSEGMHADRDHFEELLEDTGEAMERIQRKLSRDFYAGRPFNPASPDHVRTLMRRRGLEGEETTPSGEISTSKKSIQHLRHIDEALGLIFDFREQQKVQTAFCLPILEKGKLAQEADGTIPKFFRVRPQLLTTKVHTRRLASKDPNFLAMPVRSKLGKRLRDGFFPPPGHVFGGWDLSQIEMRYAAHLANDTRMCGMIHNRLDIHYETAAAIFGRPINTSVRLEDFENQKEYEAVRYAAIDKEKERTPSKNCGFGILYGISGPALYAQFRMMGTAAGWSEQKCTKLIEDWLDIYPDIRRYIAKCAEDARRAGGVIRDEWGMMRHIPGLFHYDRGVKAAAERIAMSHRVQGGAQGMIQNSMRWIDKRVRELRAEGEEIGWVLQIHDEIILHFPEELWPRIDAIVREGLTKHHGVKNMRVPVDANGNMGKHWGELK